jgi:hypothetical protein
VSGIQLKTAGELRLEYGKRDIFATPACHEPTGSRAPELNHNDGLAEYLKPEHHAHWFGFHPGNVGRTRWTHYFLPHLT